AVQSLNVHLIVGAGTTMNLDGNIAAGSVSADGAGTTSVGGFVHGIMTPINTALTLHGTLGAATGDAADFTFANGPVSTGGGAQLISHGLLINGPGGTLNGVCIDGGGLLELHSSMTVGNFGAVVNSGCLLPPGAVRKPGPGGFRIAFHGGGPLTAPASVVSNPGVEFENFGTFNLQGGTLTIWDSPLRGTPNAGSGGNFNLAAGTKMLVLTDYKMSPGVVSGDGLLEAQAPLHLGGTTISNLKSFGPIDGSFTITGHWQWMNQGVVSNGFDVIATGATLTVDPNNGGRLSGATLQVRGTANFPSLCVSDGALFMVYPGGVANANPPFGILTMGNCGGAAGSLRVDGTLNVNVTG